MRYRSMAAMVVLLFTGTAQAFDSQIFGAEAPVFSGHMQTCFSHAMVGMDSVINARLGLPPEHALDVTENIPRVVMTDGSQVQNVDKSFDEPILSVMLAAYLWQGSPHSYAIQVFYECAGARPVMADNSDFLP